MLKDWLPMAQECRCGYRWHKNIFSFKYLIECWITIDCNKLNRVLFILRRQANWKTVSKCQRRKWDGSWIFVVSNFGVLDFQNRINYSMEYKCKKKCTARKRNEEQFFQYRYEFYLIFSQYCALETGKQQESVRWNLF